MGKILVVAGILVLLYALGVSLWSGGVNGLISELGGPLQLAGLVIILGGLLLQREQSKKPCAAKVKTEEVKPDTSDDAA